MNARASRSVPWAIGLLAIVVASVVAFQVVVNPTRINLTAYTPNNLEVEEVKYAHISSPLLNDAIVRGTVTDESDPPNVYVSNYIAIISFNWKTRKWENIYHETREEGDAEVIVDRILPGGRDTVIIASWFGSGRILHYTVVGYREGEVKIFLERSDIYHGSVQIQGDQIVEKRGGQGVVFRWNGLTLIGTPAVMEPHRPYSPKDKKIEYSIDDNGTVTASEEDMVLTLGQRLLLVRTNTGPFVEAILYGDNGVLRQDGEDWVAAKIGTTSIYIGKGGLEIKVRVTDKAKGQ